LLVISTLLYGAKLLPLTVIQMKKLEAADDKFQRRLLGITWKDKLRNEEIRKKIGLWKLELIIKERQRRLRWMGHHLGLLINGGFQNTSSGYTVGTEGIQEEAATAKENWIDIVRRDLKDIGTTWDEAEELVTNRAEWCQREAQ